MKIEINTSGSSKSALRAVRAGLGLLEILEAALVLLDEMETAVLNGDPVTAAILGRSQRNSNYSKILEDRLEAARKQGIKVS